MKPRRLTRLLPILVALIGLMAGPALAADLDKLRAQGVIAERYDGYVELRKSGNAEARQVVEQVNDKRREIYRKRANKQGVPIEQVGRVYAKQLLEELPDGTYFRKPDGSYTQK